MTHTVSNTAPIPSSHTVKRYAGFGILGSDIPTIGDNGGSPVLNDGILSNSEYYWEVETPPASGTLAIYPDMSFEHIGAADGSWPWVYRLYWVDADGTNGSTTATVTDVFGTAVVILSIADATHSHATTAINLSTTGSASLSVAEGTHAHTIDNLALATQQLLAISDALHAHIADVGALDNSNSVSLILQETLHSHNTDALVLSLQTWLEIAEAFQAHYADIVVISVPTVGGPPTLPDTDIDRIVAAVLAALKLSPDTLTVAKFLALKD